MMLRVSGQISGEDADLSLVTGQGVDDGGIPYGRSLIAFVEAVMGDDDEMLANQRQQLAEAIGGTALVDAIAVIAMFNYLDRVADATGIPLDEMLESITKDIRSSLGIDEWKAAKSH